MSEHKNCPHCGGTDAKARKLNTWWCIVCENCGASTGRYGTEAGAWIMWDRRDDAAVKALVEAAKALLAHDEINTCQHEETYRGGSIWEICSQCGDMWADDRGGKPRWQDPPEWKNIRRAIKKVEGL